MASPGASNPPTDPLAMWRDWVNQSENQWNTFMNQAMATDEFSKGLGRFMDVYLNMQKSMNEAMGRYLTAANLPSRTDILALGDRLTRIEEQLTSLSSAIGDGMPGATARTARKPARTRKPVAKD